VEEECACSDFVHRGIHPVYVQPNTPYINTPTMAFQTALF
jgi:hypothetical protein